MQSLELAYPIISQGNLSEMGPQVLAIGDFDGVHLGHQEVIKRAIHTAEGLHIPASIMTFHPHPRQVLGQCKYVQLLTPVEEKKRLMEASGVNNMYIVSFNNELMKVSPSDFVENMLIPMKVNTVIVGFDFTFGYLGAGTPDTLCELAQGRFAVEVIRPFHQNGSKVSSTLVREHLLSGNLERANALLGRPYSLNGIVVHGDGRGKTIGFPTANIDLLDPFLIPALGVYAVRVTVDGQIYNSVMNVGKKPTFETNLEQPTLEAHLFEFSQSIYGNQVTVDFISYLRPERKFSGVAELIAQIQRDAEQAKLLLA
ncbi:bifunctional riboflavin kinase/FAD synthetase [Paenibacillus radicis (ex Xue et al. 2023)]|uniref:Riboflavin biosynthesis protein n=1 Tax=Paenibacillus radicis (ex Xue et al. 2023) TaxID=2972489 RepID=A0ABT1YEB5_9BACL|nr:bifunctional riboflavin kinase/FAD synthetase [Paenibacillus radicis (ex Xue et al. 2023)]MCR8630764.1 bifunctional riboflavin kinase/FAD synthetase [Paenibacillus radicis (ex Xue et al. 2023)]